MKKILLNFLFILGAILCFSQTSINSTKIEFKRFFKGHGIIFNEAYDPHIILKDEKKRFTPDENLLFACEEMLQKYFILHEGKSSTRQLRQYNRQYIGFFNNKDERLVIIQLLKIKSPAKIQMNYLNWESEYIVGFGKFYEKNTSRYIVNIDLKLVKPF
jgi:hypothetical protein